MVRFGPWFAGLAIAFIFQFMLVKGLKGSDLLKGDTAPGSTPIPCTFSRA